MYFFYLISILFHLMSEGKKMYVRKVHLLWFGVSLRPPNLTSFRILNPTDMFIIGDTSGVIETTGKPFDREVQDNYLLIVEVRPNSH